MLESLELTLSPKLLIAAAVVVFTPVSALAQAWPATGLASAPQMRSQPRAPALNFDRNITSFRTAVIPAEPTGPVIKMTRTSDIADVPDVEVRAKDAWSDDDGFRATPNKVAFKRKF